MHLLEVQGLQKYFGGLAATRNVNFHIQEGEIVGLTGLMGAGRKFGRRRTSPHIRAPFAIGPCGLTSRDEE